MKKLRKAINRAAVKQVLRRASVDSQDIAVHFQAIETYNL